MFPLILADTYGDTNTGTHWRDVFETLQKIKPVFVFNFMGGFHAKNVHKAEEFFETYYQDDGFKIIDTGFEPWYSEWMQFYDKRPFDNVWFWHSRIGFARGPDRFIYAPTWKKSIDNAINGTDPAFPAQRTYEHVNDPRNPLNKENRFFSWNRRPHPWRIDLINELLSRDMDMEIRMPHHNIEDRSPPDGEVRDIGGNKIPLHWKQFKPLEEVINDWDKNKDRILNDGVDIEPGENGAGIHSWHRRSLKTFEIISETIVKDGGLNTFASEKTFKGLRSGNLFLIYGQQGHMHNLKVRGFKLHEKYINYEYDLEVDNKKRCQLLVDEIERLYNMTNEEYSDMWHNTLRERKHNQEYSLHFNASLDKWLGQVLEENELKNAET